jgi:hypothetical protein
MGHLNRTSGVFRIALAAAVGLVCLVTSAGIALLLGGGPPATAGAQSARVAKAPSESIPSESIRSHNHSGDLGVPGMTEQELRDFETATLGPEHAAEHAALRRALRVREANPVDPEPTRNAAVAAAAAAGDPADVGRWDASATVDFAVVAIHAAMLPTGKVMIFSYPKSPEQNSAQAWLWDPATGQKVRRDPPLWLDPKDGVMKAANIWCSGHTFTADGELVVFGGNLEFPNGTKTYKGLNKVYTFNPFTETWKEQPDMRHGRWYPTGIRLPDGRIPIISGWDESGDPLMNTDVEMFTPPSSLSGLGDISLIGGTGGAGQPPTGEFYPHMFAMPSGRSLVVGPDAPNTWFMNTPTADSFTWSDAPNLGQRRLWGTAVPLPAGSTGSTKIMALGGTDESTTPSTNTTEVFDENNAGAGWQPAAPNVIGRGHANTVLLPDGSMVEVGGGIGSVATAPSPLHAATPEQRQIELWDPDTGQWRLGPEQAESRAYHSTALLLPDGRVFSAGDDWNGGIASDTAEIYEPPYLFKGARPTITSAPSNIKVGANFGVQTLNTNITRAALIAPGSVTHAVDMNQRYLELPVTQRVGCVDVGAPATANAAPPGYYMLFLVNDQGVPSVAKWVKLTTGGSVPTCTGPPVDGSAPTVSVSAPANGATVSGTINVTASASDNVAVTGVQFKLDGQNLGAEDTAAPWSRSWDTKGVANGTHQLTAVARDAAGNTRTSTVVSVTVANAAPPDGVAPTVSLPAPSAGSPVSGSINVTASASDNVGVAGVQFKLDGHNLGSEDSSSPYSVAWDTTTVANGSHELTAVARDAAGNSNTSPAESVMVANPGPGPAPPPGANNAAPVISRLKLSASTFSRGTTVSFRLSEAAQVKLSFERKLAGHKAGGKCVSPAKRGRPSCTRYSRIRTTLKLQGKAGANSLHLKGRLSRAHSLAPGRYRLTLLATDSQGKRSAPATTSFRLLDASLIRSALLSFARVF